MLHPDPAVLRAAILLLPLIGVFIAVLVQRPGYFQSVGMLLGVLLNIPYLFLLNILAEQMGWWVYVATPLSWYNIPIEIVLGWSILWGAFLPFVFRSTSIWIPIATAAFIDLIAMPVIPGLFVLGEGGLAENWLVGEVLLLMVCLVPSLVIFRLTDARRKVLTRGLIQSVIWGGWVIFLIPAIALQLNNKDIFDFFEMSTLRTSMFLIGMAGSMVIGYLALVELALKGQGTPIPFDPPKHLVVSGIYSRVANPLQLSTVLMLTCIMFAFASLLMLVPIAVFIFFSEVFVRWHHTIDIEKRFGSDWINYRRRVRKWLPSAWIAQLRFIF